MLCVGHRWKRLERRHRRNELRVRFTRVDEQTRAVGHDDVRGIAAARGDEMDIEIALLPGRQRLRRIKRKCGRCETEDCDHRDESTGQRADAPTHSGATHEEFW